MNHSRFNHATYEDVAEYTGDNDLLTVPGGKPEPAQPSGLGRFHGLGWKPRNPRRLSKYLMVGGVAYTVLWSILLYFGWKGSPDFITWLDLITGVFLLHLACQLYRATDITRNGKLLRWLQLASLLYATAWTLIVMLVFGVEILLPLDFVSLFATISLMRRLWRSLWTH